MKNKLDPKSLAKANPYRITAAEHRRALEEAKKREFGPINERPVYGLGSLVECLRNKKLGV